MFLVMLKKELKMFFRSKGNVLMLFLFPIILITTLGLGLNGLMSGEVEIFGQNDKDSIVYYTIDDNAKYGQGFNQFMEGIKSEIDIKFEATDSLNRIKNKIDEKKAIAYVSLHGDKFDIYTSNTDETMKAKVFKSILESLFNQYAVYETIGEINPEALRDFVSNKYDEYVVSENVKGARTVTASEYYTFAELALIILNVAAVIGELVYKEKQLKTISRIKMSKATESTMILSKVALGVIISILQVILVYVYSSLVLKVNWGENTLKYILLFIVFGLFSSMLGAVVGMACKNDTSVSGILSGFTFATCALGGCYTTRAMITSIPIINKLMYISPIYWINTATSTMISGLESNLYFIAIIIPIFLSALLFILYNLVMKRRGAALDV